MAAIQLLFACCVRGRTRRRQREGPDERVIPDEESRLIPPPAESEPNVPNAVGQEIEERNARLGTIVRAKGGNMINTSAYAPFNVLNRPYRHLPQRYGPNRSGSSNRRASSSRSMSREDHSETRRRSVVRYGQSYLAHGYGYGAVGVSYNPSLVHTMSIPAPLEPQSSEVQVQIQSAVDGRTSLERNVSRKRDGKKGPDTGNGEAEAAAASDMSNNKTPQLLPRFRSTLVMSPSTTSIQKSTSHESFPDSHHSHSNSNSGDITFTGGTEIIEGLGVRLVQPPPSSSDTVFGPPSAGLGLGMSRRGRPKVRTRGGSFSSPVGSGYGSAASGSSANLVRVRSREEDSTTVQNGTGFSSSEQTPRPLSIIPPPPPHHLLGSATPIGTLPATYLSTSPAATFLAPPPSPHSDRNSDSGQSALLRTPPHVPPPLPLTLKPPPVFEIKDEGELTIGWDD
ncbi:hypothetical protein F5876DRAFT_67997 [Lentinula aff. lateritia]|uniref:Uncharacterized protein n=1 Tax=Lentinula aff. lateritia TaxID=2804960 RepID=A0ACC1TST6_9AGAR|nr:hypothetical protein F5876DRAFT_67997 [Lentinula aff. lateritia]